MSSPEGWYEDPFGRLPLRWWDGAAWSPYARGTDVVWDPLPITPVTASRAGIPAMGVALTGFALGVALSFGVIIALRAAGTPGGVVAELVLGEIALWLPLLGACGYVSSRRGTGSWRIDFDLRWRPMDIGLGLAGSVAARSSASLALLPIVVFQFQFRLPDVSAAQSLTHSAAAWAAVILVMCVGAPFVEELFFRGLIQTRLAGRYGPVIGIGVTSIMFGSAHLIGWAGPISLLNALAITGAGVSLGLIRQLSNRLGTSMMAHSFFNAQALIIVALLHSGAFTIR